MLGKEQHSSPKNELHGEIAPEFLDKAARNVAQRLGISVDDGRARLVKEMSTETRGENPAHAAMVNRVAQEEEVSFEEARSRIKTWGSFYSNETIAAFSYCLGHGIDPYEAMYEPLIQSSTEAKKLRSSLTL